MTTTKPHNEWREIGLPWLARVPAHWEVQRGKTLFDAIDVRSKTGAEELLTVSANHGVIPRNSANVTMFQAETYDGYKLCWPDDLVINSLWAWSKGLAVSNYHGIISSAYGVYRTRNRLQYHPRFVNYLARSTPFQWELQIRSKGIWISRLQLTDEAFLAIPFPVPPPEEQAAIVRFLDHADEQIQRYIAGKERLIALLEEERQAVIHQAVTQGLDPNVKLKDSGVEWLGDVPEHWETARLGSLGRFSKGNGGTKEDEVSAGVPCIRYGDIYTSHKYFITASRAYIEPEKTSQYTPLRFGDILFAGSGETIEEIGKSAVNLIKEPSYSGGDVIIFRPTVRMNAEFTGYATDSPAAQLQKSVMGRGFTVMHIYGNQLKNLQLAIPPIHEQANIVEHISQGTGRIDNAASQAHRQIDLMNEYRTRLIADVVTGQLDVRETVQTL